MKKIICYIFGHNTNGDKHDGSDYMKISKPYHDGIGRGHCQIHTECKRCGKEFRVGAVHAYNEEVSRKKNLNQSHSQ